ncbi:amidohydrolase family protein, partial [Mobiluncus curtisii]
LLADAAGGGCILELIADGQHVDPSAVRNVFELVGRDSVVFVSNATADTGMPFSEPDSAEGEPNLHLVDIVRRAWKGAGIPLTDAVYCASVQGARILGQTNIGEITPGKRADLLVTDENLYPLAVYR